ncbi:transmembrane protein 177 [Colletes gigas]|uniref:transmembrane protein 177 n=1 Tax=Colletes gigas TaxID=935657 RepID=UPI001C9AC87F|nr:transmembrane protein 177 [Colletes gigas]XP_043264717.1 transmembrane protein 177 [Colletes gigas]XP_043264718.1 transmembrane protein 177 [Colletes gigas]
MTIKHIAILGTTTIVLGATTVPHSIGLETYRKLRAKYRMNKTEEPVKRKYKNIFQEVMDDLKLEEEEKKKLQIFNVIGYDMFHAGSTSSKYGGAIGIPMHFQYTDVNSVDKDNIYLMDKPVDWGQRAGTNFLNSLILSDDAKKFAIAQEILKVKGNQLLNLAVETLINIGIVIIVYNLLYKGFKISQRKKLVRYSFHIIATMLGSLLYRASAVMRNYTFEMKIDEQLAQLNPKYIEGGKEFYSKLLSRNIALRTLLGETGPKLFTVDGNEKMFLWPRTVSIFDKKFFFESRMENTEQLV